MTTDNFLFRFPLCFHTILRISIAFICVQMQKQSEMKTRTELHATLLPSVLPCNTHTNVRTSIEIEWKNKVKNEIQCHPCEYGVQCVFLADCMLSQMG